MKIAINTRFLLPNKMEGIGVFTHEVVKRMVVAQPDHQFFFFFDRDFDNDFIYAPNVTGIKVSPPARHPFLYVLWFEYRLPQLFKKHGIQLFFSPDGYLSLRTNIPQIPVFHDLAFEHFPADITRINAWHYRKYFLQFAQKAARILTVSVFSKLDIQKIYKIDPPKIEVVYNGSKDIFQPLEETQIEETRNKYAEGLSYFIYVGALHPRKNISRLLLAFDAFKEKGGKEKLILCGRKAWLSEAMEKTYKTMKWRHMVVFTDRVSDSELHLLIGSAKAMIYISYFEGFGIPVLEAMNCDVPSIVANNSSLPEVGGNACLQVDPFSIESISDAMMELSQNEFLRKSLIENGHMQRQLFSWDLTAKKVWKNISIVAKEFNLIP